MQETNYSETYVLYYLDIPLNLKAVFGLEVTRLKDTAH